VIEEAQVVVHEDHKPDFLGDFPDADRLARERMTEMLLRRPKQMRHST
jgi:hypothetical protein